ncbi:MAG: hypothetical protein EXQ94_13160 [Alphaproteobacteria bacterium]|nr:hypothetical protein [Alphaproteobacteria bacterium]
MRSVVEFAPDIEADVRFVEDTAPAVIVAATLKRLRDGADPKRLLTAAALAVSRSTELPPDHHGGPVHPVCGLHPVNALSRRLAGTLRFAPVVQSVALANKHVHTDEMGPVAMPALAPLAVAPTEAGKAAFLGAINRRYPVMAERLLLGALESLPPSEVLELLLRIAIPRNALDDHYFLYTVFAARALDALGWEHAGVVLRPCVRFLAGNPMLDSPGYASLTVDFDRYYAGNHKAYRAFGKVEALIEGHKLMDGRLLVSSGKDESKAIAKLGERIGNLAAYGAIPALLAKAMGGGLSLAGTAEALSYAAGLLSLRSNSGNLFNTHFHSGINARRYLIGRDGVSLRTKVLALLSWPVGPEVRLMEGTMTWPAAATPEELSRLPSGAAELTAAIEGALRGLAVFNYADYADPNDAKLPEATRHLMALAQRYAALGHDGEAMFDRLAAITCTDDASEMHAYKLQQAAYEEWRATREPLRWVHLASAVKHAGNCYCWRPHTVFGELEPLLRAS